MPVFDEQQQEAIRHRDGPMMVIAGPGSGKTTVTTNRIDHMISTGVRPDQILAITFTKAAAAEMRERYLKLSKSDDTDVTFGTFHSVFLTILRTYVSDFKAELVDSAGAMRILRKTCEREFPALRLSADYLFHLLTGISRIKNGFRIRDPVLERVLPAYNRALLAEDMIDFDDMLLLCCSLLKKDPQVLKELQERYRYLMLDEFQDINRIQFEIIRLLAQRNQNLFVVGDDDQSIYGFRGSDPEIMLHFADYFPQTRVVRLMTNYRSSVKIVGGAAALIRHNRNRYPKQLRAVKSIGSGIRIVRCLSAEEEAEAVLAVLKALKPEETAAVLYRTHRAGLPIAEFLLCGQKAIPRRQIEKQVRMMTFHASKGLEFDVVLIVEANDHVTPGRKKTEAELEEERRMFYVAMTRARAALHIFYTDYGYNKKCKCSRYIYEIRK